MVFSLQQNDLPMTSTLSLNGTRILVGRARHQAGRLSEALRQLGAEVIEIPFIEIRPPASFEPLDAALKNLSAYDWLILTSANGVEALFGRLEDLDLPATSLSRLKIAAIGPATRRAIEARGVSVTVMPEEYVAEAVVSALRHEARNSRVLLVRAAIARDVIPRELAAAGARVDVIEAYETSVPEESRQSLAGVLADPARRPQVIPFTSSSSVRNFVELAGRNAVKTALQDGMRLASIGPVTSATLRELELPVSIEAREYTIPGLVEAIAEAVGAKI
jgi:uroporphyrinogen-III synthase